MTDKLSDVIEKLRERLARLRSMEKEAETIEDKAVMHWARVKLKNELLEHADLLLSAASQAAPAHGEPKCRHGCKEAIGLYHLPNGCPCFDDDRQWLCEQHLVKLRNNGYEADPIFERPQITPAPGGALKKLEDAREYVRDLWRGRKLSEAEHYRIISLIDAAEKASVSAPGGQEGWQHIYKTLKAIAEGYGVRGENDQYIVVENPTFREDDGSDVNLVIDVVALEKMLATSPTPVRSAPDVVEALHTTDDDILVELLNLAGNVDHHEHRATASMARRRIRELRAELDRCRGALEAISAYKPNRDDPDDDPYQQIAVFAKHRAYEALDIQKATSNG